MRSVRPEMFREQYGRVFEGDEQWQSLPTPEGELFGGRRRPRT
jgi:aconitate hydratase